MYAEIRKAGREIRRVNWIRRAEKQKKRWFSAAFKGKAAYGQRRWERTIREVGSFCLWTGLGLLMLAVSWVLFWKTGEISVSDNRLATDDGRERKEETGKEGEIRPKEGGWSGEVFGIEIQLKDGKIVFFREKEEEIENLPFIR